MLTELDVIAAVCRDLSQRGYLIKQQLGTTQKGYDVIADKPGIPPLTIRVEAKGLASALVTSARYGMELDSAQVKDHVAAAFYKACETIGRYPTSRSAIALPDSPRHRACAARIHHALVTLGIGVFWVRPDGNVVDDCPWDA